MKRFLSLILSIIIVLSLVACGKINEEQGKKYCSNCDEMISESAKFCEHCGCDLSQNTDTVINSDNGDYTFEDYVNDNQSSNAENDTPPVSTPDYTQDNNKYKSTCLAVGCDNLPNNLNFYCSEHACAKSGCTSEKSYSSSFCSRHKCDSIGCDNGSNEWGYYCSEHACAENNCSREKNYGYSSVYCSYHECNEVGCENRKKGYGSYCSQHECANPYCSSQKFSIYDYCIIHYDD